MKQKSQGSTANTFGSFLQAVQKHGVEKEPKQDLTLVVLRILKGRPCSIPELLKETGEGPGRVISTLGEMERIGLVALSGDQEKTATATASGIEVLDNYDAESSKS